MVMHYTGPLGAETAGVQRDRSELLDVVRETANELCTLVGYTKSGQGEKQDHTSRPSLSGKNQA